MAELQCKKCGSTNVKKNGTKPGGSQQYHCRDCGVYTTTAAYAQAHAAKLSQVDELHHEGMSQSAIARQVGLSRPTIIAHLKKSLPPHRGDLNPEFGAARARNRRDVVVCGS